MVYLFTLVPFGAVTATGITFVPTANDEDALALPEATGVPFTLTPAVDTAATGVTLSEVVVYGTLSV
jgi:hypothetical protein